MKNMLAFLMTRLRERSTWLGLISLLTGLGVALEPELQEAVIAAGMGLAGVIGIMSADKK